MSSPFRLLCAGDVHLGRRPARTPPSNDALSVQHVWRRFIHEAVDRAVDAVVLTGDVVDEENKMYESFGALERGIRRLLNADIPVVAVAGNHDYDAFPRLVRGIDDERFHLLGQGGTWEAVRLENEAGRAVRFVGWSFPARHVPRSPLEGADLDAAAVPTLGVLHADAGRTEGRYAPVGRDALARAPVDAWLLGHIHTPTPHREGSQLQLYTGSLQPLDPGETGDHGAWLVTVDASGVEEKPVPLASLRYDAVTVDVTDCADRDAVEAATLEALRDGVAQAADTHPHLRHVVYRLVYAGRTTLHDAIEELGRERIRELTVPLDDVEATVDAVEVEARPAYDLEDLARGDDPVGVLAALLLDLEAGRETEAVQTVLRDARKKTQTLHAATGYEPLRRDSTTRDAPDDEALRTWAQRQGYRLLDAMVEGS